MYLDDERRGASWHQNLDLWIRIHRLPMCLLRQRVNELGNAIFDLGTTLGFCFEGSLTSLAGYRVVLGGVNRGGATEWC